MNNFNSVIDDELRKLDAVTRAIAESVWQNRFRFIKWPESANLLWDGCYRVKYHQYPEELKRKIKLKGINADSRSNGPAIVSYLFAGGVRPTRQSNPNQQWHIHHIYDGKFPWSTAKRTLHAVKDGKHFTQSAGLVAIHPIANALAGEYAFFAWLLRHESYLKFNYDPELMFCREIDRFGFKIT